MGWILAMPFSRMDTKYLFSPERKAPIGRRRKQHSEELPNICPLPILFNIQ
jgi:hypothetical protein